MQSIYSRVIPIPEPRTYPYMGINKNHGFIVLFTGSRAGVVVYSDTSSYVLGRFDDTWYEENFDVFHGTITITT